MDEQISVDVIHVLPFSLNFCVVVETPSLCVCVLVAPPPPKRAPSTSLTLRSKSMTADLEEIGNTNTNTIFDDIESNCTTVLTFVLSAARRRRFGESHDLDSGVTVSMMISAGVFPPDSQSGSGFLQVECVSSGPSLGTLQCWSRVSTNWCYCWWCFWFCFCYSQF